MINGGDICLNKWTVVRLRVFLLLELVGISLLDLALLDGLSGTVVYVDFRVARGTAGRFFSALLFAQLDSARTKGGCE